MAYLEARHIPLELAKAHGLGYFPPGKWPGRKAFARWGRVAFPLETPEGPDPMPPGAAATSSNAD